MRGLRDTPETQWGESPGGRGGPVPLIPPVLRTWCPSMPPALASGPVASVPESSVLARVAEGRPGVQPQA